MINGNDNLDCIWYSITKTMQEITLQNKYVAKLPHYAMSLRITYIWHYNFITLSELALPTCKLVLCITFIWKVRCDSCSLSARFVPHFRNNLWGIIESVISTFRVGAFLDSPNTRVSSRFAPSFSTPRSSLMESLKSADLQTYFDAFDAQKQHSPGIKPTRKKYERTNKTISQEFVNPRISAATSNGRI